ncbi:AAEL006537-PA [Aedes aegypti]|uniref:AAEL006537-PA n=1 Tax=Aedes aegypti TaxID=7159 RepID=Q175V0_AEDAE|nr:AAEL006537-PA [Aedes aegypti]
MYIKSGHRFLSDKGQIVFPGPPTRSAFSFSYTNPPTTTTTASTTTVALPDPPEIDDDTNYIDMWRSKSTSGSDMLSDKIQMFYIYITVTITSVFVLILLGIFGYMCYKRKGFQSIENQQDIETTRRQSSRRSQRRHSMHCSKEREASENPGQTLLR